ncbi:hypothetical protein Acr_23g0017310 [Actinidia rufa]|uniref:Chromo domain-containing protein n=1 Tax=Actinidia rufa TaxID=165716 RepID=A0A7J0GRB0_9ERIC|nr:hypothetical protein Acr_23g0017310 [Actinidia rufa]
MVEQLTASVQQIQRDRHQIGGNGAGPARPNQPVLERPPNFHRNEPRDLIINVEAPTFDGRLDPKAFTDWTREMDHFFECKPSFGRRFESRNTLRPPATLPPSKPVPNTAPLLRDGKERGILAESPGMKSTFQCYKCQGFGHKAANCGNRTLFVNSQGVVRCALTQAKEDNDWRRNAIFYTYIKCGEKDCKNKRIKLNPLQPKPASKQKKENPTNGKGLNIISPKEFEREINDQSILFAVVAHEASTENQDTPPKEVTSILQQFHEADSRRRCAEFQVGDYVMVRIRPERDGGVQRFLVRWSGRPTSDDTWITSDDLQQIDRDLFEYYQSRPSIHSTESSFLHPGRVGGDTGSRPPITRVYGRRSKKAYPVSLWLDSGLLTGPDA